MDLDPETFFSWGDKEGESDYTVQILSPDKRTYNAPPCPFYEGKKSGDCPLPISDDSVKSLLDKFFKPQPKPKRPKNSWNNWSYGHDSSEDEKEDKEEWEPPSFYKNDSRYTETDYYNKKKCFELELFWNRSLQYSNLDKVKRCKVHEKIEEYEKAAEEVV